MIEIAVDQRELQENGRKIDLPLVLISEIQRSGGTLLSQLFDGHPSVLAFPHELHMLKGSWPDFRDGIPRKAMATHNRRFGVFAREGYRKFATVDGGDRHPFVYDMKLRDRLFTALLEGETDLTARAVISAFMTAFFRAWKSRRGSLSGKRYLVAFAPGANLHYAQEENPGFFSEYPDGFLISLARHPLSWHASARLHSEKYEPFADAMCAWIASTEASLSLHRRFPERVVLLVFEEVVRSCRTEMQRLAARLGLEFDEALCVPSFDGYPTKSNSSFRPTAGIDRDVLAREEYCPRTAEEADLLETALKRYREVAEISA